MPRPKKPIAQHILDGTYRADRHELKANNEIIVADLLKTPIQAKIKIPKSLTAKSSRNYYKDVVTNLIRLNSLAGVDLKQIERLCLILERIESIDAQIKELDPFDDNYLTVYTTLLNTQIKLETRFDNLAAKYYISPVARQKIALDILEIEKKKTDLEEKKMTALDSIIAKKVN